MDINQLFEIYPTGMERVWAFLPFSTVTDTKSQKIIIQTVLNTNGRVLYDFFDKYGMHVTITTNTESWGYKIISKLSPYTGDDWYVSRNDAEKAGFLKAFSLLEKQLKK